MVLPPPVGVASPILVHRRVDGINRGDGPLCITDGQIWHGSICRKIVLLGKLACIPPHLESHHV